MEREEQLFEALCKKGKAYAARRKAAGEKHGAYLMGRAVKVCKGQIKGENLNEAEGQVNVYGYQTKHFDVCPGAQSLYKKITDEKLKDDAVESAKLQDALSLASDPSPSLVFFFFLPLIWPLQTLTALPIK